MKVKSKMSERLWKAAEKIIIKTESHPFLVDMVKVSSMLVHYGIE